MTSSQVPVARFEEVNEDVPQRKHVDVLDREVKLLRGDRTVAQVPVTGTTIDVVVSPDGRWVWRLHEEDSALATLLNGNTLETIAVFRSPDCDGEGFLGEWYEHTAVASAHAPDMLVVFAKAGDSFVLLLTLRATAEGIADVAGPSMFEAVEPLLDEVIGYASFIAPDRVLVLDDIG